MQKNQNIPGIIFTATLATIQRLLVSLSWVNPLKITSAVNVASPWLQCRAHNS